MSCYLTFYIETAKKEKLSIVSYSRSSDIYAAFYENLNIEFSDSDVKYTKVSADDIGNVMASINSDISSASARLTEYEKYAKDNPKYINEIISLKEYIGNLKRTVDTISLLYNIADDAENGFVDAKGVYVSIT